MTIINSYSSVCQLFAYCYDGVDAFGRRREQLWLKRFDERRGKLVGPHDDGVSWEGVIVSQTLPQAFFMVFKATSDGPIHDPRGISTVHLETHVVRELFVNDDTRNEYSVSELHGFSGSWDTVFCSAWHLSDATRSMMCLLEIDCKSGGIVRVIDSRKLPSKS